MKKMLPEVFKGYDKPAERLAVHQRIYFSDGTYKGTQYIPTALGNAVYNHLKRRGWLAPQSTTGAKEG
ncbi:MAG: hypothetical protein EOS25_13335 [Mesorhizobium sp.]|uniref:hypothetical protein n=1 Tax=Mesorhizobium sp. TaxID=1871066 RepID=UPI000FE7C159|nr:hypothetical protein [Mesorhizobium sp.]RWD45166.1 MAG: hypothetical protein EOS59_22050 [Mesorhizobium sp.]RWE52722.1 MAG: hypothetical protein EOS24_29185 [Mesorhizobium sp.]RWF07404.1 MAG: hypothetical protein EOS69_28825 [Mesorhizobium sp.]RWF18643.1 MAG: hypothetical protein EOS25_13335 [Mesorhizobium sp.]TIW49986.1 MAG: hypothetical protein E5V71_00060 [Mesorhizobium sp.]